MSVIEKGDYAQVLLKNGVLSFAPNGNSMWPFIKNRKQTVVIEKPLDTVKKFDVLLYVRPDGSYVLHRVVEILKDGYLMRGDSQNVAEKIDKDCVIGVMTSFFKGKKQILVNDENYVKKVEKWYKDYPLTRLRKKLFSLKNRIKYKLSKTTKKGN